MIQPNELGAIALGAALVGLFTGYWFPRELENNGEGRLPKNFRVGVLFAMMNVIFFALVLTFVFLSAHAPDVAAIFGAAGVEEVQTVIKTVQTSMADDGSKVGLVVTAVGVFFGLFGLQRCRQIEAGTLRQLHNVSLVEEDETRLAERLKSCRFETSYAEHDESGIEALDRLQRRLDDGSNVGPVRSLAVMARKLEALLKLWKDDDAWAAPLPRANHPKLKAARHAHKRRMRLALRVNEHLEKIDRGELDLAGLTESVAALKKGKLTSTAFISQLKQSSSEPSQDSSDDRSVREIVHQLVDFLLGGYEENLDELASATAKATIMSGDDAQAKLEALKKAGFSGLGRIVTIDLHRAIMILLVIFFFVLFVFFVAPHVLALLGNHLLGGGQPFIFVIATSITLAAVVGTMVGGLRNLANAARLPWGWYFLAAFAVAVAHVAAVVAARVLDLTITDANPEYDPVQFAMAGSLVPFFLVLGICLLSRRDRPTGRLPEWVTDGIQFSLFMLVGGFLFNMVVELAELPPPRPGAGFPERMLLIGFVTLAIGAFVGSVVVHQVRAAALSSIVLDEEAAEA